VAYNRPTWRELVQEAVDDVLKAYSEVENAARAQFPDETQRARKLTSLSDLRKTLTVLHGCDPCARSVRPIELASGEQLKLAMEVCESLARRLDAFVEEQRLRLPKRRSSYSTALRRTLAKAVGEKGYRKKDPDLDPLRCIYNDLQIRRMLTVNYDRLIEVHLAKERGFANLDATTPVAGTPGLETRGRDNLDRSALSVTLTDDSMGELFIFASLPRSYEAQIFHVHGSTLEPNGLVLTEHDYRKLYLRMSANRRSFYEALDVLFYGNDILFLGVGMNESDLLRPLRQFLAEERAPVHEGRRIFCFLPFENTADATARAVDLSVRYGVNTLFFGKGRDSYERMAASLLMKLADRSEVKESPKARQAWLARELGVLKDQVRSDLSDHEQYNKGLAGTSALDPYAPVGDLKAFVESPPGQELRWLRTFCAVRLVNKGWSRLEMAARGERIEKIADLRRELEEHQREVTTRNLCQFIQACANEQKQWWRDWHEAPMPRVSTFAPPGETVWVRHRPAYVPRTGDPSPAMKEAARLAEELCVAKPMGRRILRLASDRGSGKGVFLFDLHQDFASKPLFPDARYAGAFLAQTAFSPEFNSVILGITDLLRGQLAPEVDVRNENAGYLHDLEQVLIKLNGQARPKPERERFLICLSGLDRLCNAAGFAYNPAHGEFFRLLSSEKYANVPIDFVFISGDPNTPIRDLGGAVAGSGSAQAPQAVWHKLPALGLNDRHWLFDINRSGRILAEKELDGHAPRLAAHLRESVALDHWVSKCVAASASSPGARTKLIDTLEQAAMRGGRLEILRQVFEFYKVKDGADGGKSHIRETILKHLLLFSMPVQPAVLLSCPQLRELLRRGSRKPHSPTAWLTRQLRELDERGLIIAVSFPRNGTPGGAEGQRRAGEDERDSETRYILHPQMRDYLGRQMGFGVRDRSDINYYSLSVYCVQPRDLPVPSAVHFKLVYEVVQSLIDDARDVLEPFYRLRRAARHGPGAKPPIALPEEPEIRAIPQRLRAGLAIISGTFSVGAISRLRTFQPELEGSGQAYDLYRGWLRSLINAAAGIEYVREEMNAVARKTGAAVADPFYLDEILWLYNERGVMAYLQGRLYDAIPVFRHALNIAEDFGRCNPHARASQRGEERRIRFNLAISQIDRGNIRRAREDLKSLTDDPDAMEQTIPGQIRKFARGYLGICDHLTGNFEAAQKRYHDVIEYAKEHELTRTLVIFHHHRGDLLRILGDRKAAELDLKLAVHLAAQAEQEDVLHLVLVSQAHLALANRAENPEGLAAGLKQLGESEQYAEALGLPRLKVDALRVRAEIVLEQGDAEHAGRLTSRAIAIANRHGMRLRKTSCLIVYARILHARGELRYSRYILEEALREARRCSYHLKAELAGRLLRELHAGEVR
jgi:tetratricopeptide (TPR) repeat protein